MADKQLVLQETHKNLMALLTSKQDAMPKDFNPTRFLQNCMTVLQDTKEIEKCQPISIARTLLKGAFLGLDFFQKECYAIPYGNSLQFQTDYKGETKMAKKYSIRPILDIYAKVVREDDIFKESIVGGKQIINFNPVPFSNKPIVGAFAIVLYKDGGMEYDTMSTEQIESVKENYSKKGYKTGEYSKAWVISTGEMYKKTVLRRLTKKIEKDFDSIEQAQAYEESSDTEFKKEEKQRSAVPDILYKQDEPIDVEIVEDNADEPKQ